MILSDIKIFRFLLPLKQPLSLRNRTLTSREGIVLQVTDQSGHSGLGEAAPLPGFSPEDVGTALKECLRLKRFMVGAEIPPDLASLKGAFDQWLEKAYPLSPSTRFGFESAVLSLLAASQQTTLPKLLGATSPDAIPVNGLLVGDRNQVMERAGELYRKGFRTFKLKVGLLPLEEETKRVAGVRRIIGADCRLRLDANKSWDIAEALVFTQRVAAYDIDYLEEPVRNLNQLRKLLGEKSLAVPLALDESLAEIKPEDLSRPYPIKAIVIKPTILGLERAMRFIRSAQDNSILPVVSSSFESSIGLYVLASMAAVAGGSEIAAGLDTIDWLDRDLIDPPLAIDDGSIHVSAVGANYWHLCVDASNEVLNE